MKIILKLMLILICFNIFREFAFSNEIVENELCPELDYQNRFSIIKDQGYNQVCWAMAASSLLEEEACIEDASQCGKSQSATDITRCDKKIYHEDETSIPKRALECGIMNGVCSDEYAPYIQFRKKKPIFSFGSNKSPFASYRLFAVFFQIKSSNILSLNISSPLFLEFLNEFRKIYFQFDLSDLEILEKIKMSKDEVEFLDQMLVSKKCEQNRFHFSKNRSVFTKVFTNVTPHIARYFTSKELREFGNFNSSKTQKDWIIDRLMSGRSLALGICSQHFSVLERLFTPGGDCVAGHVIVANGLRKNPVTDVCEIHLRDSRLQSITGVFNGWFPLGKISKSTYLIEQIQ